MRKMILVTILCLSACKTTQQQPLTLGLSPEQLQEAPAVALCLDNTNYVLPEVESVIKKRKINCNSELRKAYIIQAKKYNNADACQSWMFTEDPIARDVMNKEIKSRSLDCGQILTAKAQQDAVIAQEAANRQAAWNAINQSIQNQNAINAMNRPRTTTCYGYSCTTY